MFQRLSGVQVLVLVVLTIVWLIGLVWICIHKPKPAEVKNFDKLMEWRIYWGKPTGTIAEWFGYSPGGDKGPPVGNTPRWEGIITWTALVGMIASTLFIQWTRLD
jgi:hypothetical protein